MGNRTYRRNLRGIEEETDKQRRDNLNSGTDPYRDGPYSMPSGLSAPIPPRSAVGINGLGIPVPPRLMDGSRGRGR